MDSTPHLSMRVPELKLRNYRIWKCTITTYAAQSGIAAHITTEVPVPAATDAAAAHAWEKAEAKLLLLSSKSTKALTRIGDAALEKDLHEIMAKVAESFATVTNAVENERLRGVTDKICIQPKESNDDYIDRHLSVRAEMEAAQYP